MSGKKVVVGLSGGVDSSVAAALLIEQGYEVHGVYLECYNEPGCRTDQDKKDALKVAIQLKIPFEVLDFRKEYKDKVIEYFYTEYEAGRTPNPDVMCNREIKFGIFYDWAIQNGFDYVATGHYCRIAKFTNSNLQFTSKVNFHLQRARDESKDQSYFLWQIPSDHLKHILFPLGEMLKSEVREKAKELKLPTASKPDSMGICFIGEVDVSKLLRERLGEKPGDVAMYPAGSDLVGHNISDLRDLTLNGTVVGRHKGLWFYTIGQRGGWEMGELNHYTIKTLHHLGIDRNDLPPLYVIGKDKEQNQLIVGSREEVMTNRFCIMNNELCMMSGQKWWVRIRNLGELIEVEDVKGNIVKLKAKIFAPAGGQSAVFYDANGVLVQGSIIV